MEKAQAQAKKVLLMHIGDVSGHHCASTAIEKALQEIDAQAQTHKINILNYTSSRLTKAIHKFYLFIVKVVPWVWDYLYDNRNILKKVKKARLLIHRLSTKKIEGLFNNFRPDVVVCTQAFPCGLVADYKRRHNLKMPLIGVLTDYATHAYWLNDFVNAYVVPAAKIQKEFRQRGVALERLKILGIPIDAKFKKRSNRPDACRRLGLNPDLPAILIMGGGQGLGPIKEIARSLDALSPPAQLIVVCGTNKGLYKWLNRNKTLFKTPLLATGYATNIDELMDVSSFVVSKAGGLTCAEALSKGLPIIIINPLPGQENRNSQFLLEMKVALKARNFHELRLLAAELLSNPVKLDELRKRAASLAFPEAAYNIARLILNMAEAK